ncbi:MAG: hypothetical protein ACXVNO_01455 [Bacteroidia bacterium]
MSLKEKLSKGKWKLKYLDEAKAEENASTSLNKTLIQGLLGGVIGGYAGHKIGKPAFLVGLGGMWLGHFFGVSWAAPVGIGMMAGSITDTSAAKPTPTTTTSKTVSGIGSVSSEKAFANSLLERTYLDKLINHFEKKPKPQNREIASTEEVNTTEGIGSNEGSEEVGATDDYNQALARIEKDLYASAIRFKKQRGESTAGLEDEMQGTDEDVSGF